MTDTAEKNVRDILSIAVEYSDKQNAVVIFDAQCELAAILTDAYRRCIPKAKFIDFDKSSPQIVIEIFESLQSSDLVVLIQSTSFRLETFRIRINLFNRSLKVIEHPHLANIRGKEMSYYIDSLAYDPEYYRGTGSALKKLIDRARTGVINSRGAELVFASGFEPAKLNVGDYRQMKNVGGQFPIGEVFTEAKDLEMVNGRARIFAFGDTSFMLNKPAKPIKLGISKGRVTDVNGSTPEFDRVLANIRADEGEIWVRELGFGMNRAFTQERSVSDIGSYERMCGTHLSLGAKHALYKKPRFTRTTALHHVDVFMITESVTLDGKPIYQNGGWII